MELNKEHIIFGAVCLVAGIVLGAGFRSCSKPAEPAPAEPAVKHDTVIIHDTAYIAAKTKPVKKLPPDTIKAPVPNEEPNEVSNSANSDSIIVQVPMTAYEFRDTITTDTSRIELGIQFSGYKAKIDGIDLKSQYTIQPRTIEKKKGWGQFIGIGIGVGYGASFVGNPSGVGTIVYAAPEIGVHITYGWGYHW